MAGSTLHDDFDKEPDLHSEFDKEVPVAKSAPQVAPDTSVKDKAALTKSAGQTFVGHAFNSALGGLGTKAQAALYAGILNRDPSDKADFSTRYHDALRRADEVDANSEEAHPTAALTGDVSGGFATAPLMGGGGGVKGLIGAGAAFGASNAYGADRNEEFSGESIGNALGGAVTGGVGGAFLGAGGKEIGAVAGKAISPVSRYLASKAGLAKQGVIDGAVEKLGGEVYPEGVKAQLDGRISRGVDSWGKDVGGSVSNDVETSSGLESTRARQGRMAAKVGRDVRQAHAILANPDGFSQEEVAAARRVADANGGPSYRGMPNSKEAARNVQASSMGDNTNPMTSRELKANFDAGGTPARAPESVAPWDGKTTAPLPEMKSTKPYARSFDMESFGKPESEQPAMLSPQAKFDPNEPTANLGPNGNSKAVPKPEPTGPIEMNVTSRAQGSGIDDMVRDHDFFRAMQLGEGGAPGSLASVLMGAGKGAVSTGLKAALPSGGLGMLSHGLGEAAEGGAIARGAIKGGIEALSPGQKAMALQKAAQISKTAEGYMASSDNEQRSLGQMLMRAAQSGKSPETKQKADPKHGQPNDSRNN